MLVYKPSRKLLFHTAIISISALLLLNIGTLYLYSNGSDFNIFAASLGKAYPSLDTTRPAVSSQTEIDLTPQDKNDYIQSYASKYKDILSQISSSDKNKVLVVSTIANRPEFIELQYRSLKKYLREPFDYVVINDGLNIQVSRVPDVEIKIGKECERLGIPSLLVPEDPEKYPSLRCAGAIKFAYNNLIRDSNRTVMLIDSDMFFVDKFSITEYLNGSLVAGVKQLREQGSLSLTYIWNGIVLLDMKRIPDKESISFDLITIDGLITDVGGYWYHYFQKHPEVKLKPIPHISSGSIDAYWLSRNKLRPNLHKLLVDEIALAGAPAYSELYFESMSLFHYRSGSGWNLDSQNAEYHTKRIELIKNFIHQDTF